MGLAFLSRGTSLQSHGPAAFPASCSRSSQYPGTGTDPFLLRGEKGHLRFVPSLLKGSSWLSKGQLRLLSPRLFTQGLCRDIDAPALVPPDLNPLTAKRRLLQHLRRQAVGLDTTGQHNGNPTECSLSESGTLNARARSREHPAKQATGLYSVPKGCVQMRACEV